MKLGLALTLWSSAMAQGYFMKNRFFHAGICGDFMINTVAVMCSWRLILLALLTFASPIHLYAQPASNSQPDVPEIAKKNISWEAALYHGSRKIEIHAVTEQSGITAGFIIAYGHPILSPYLIERRDRRVYVNGVQISPSLIQEREHPAAPKLRQSPGSLTPFGKMPQDIYREEIGKKPLLEVHADILQIVNAAGTYSNAKWVSSNVLELQRAGDGGMVVMEFSDRKQLAPEERKKYEDANSEKLWSAHLVFLKKSLLDGHTIIFPASGAEATYQMDIRPAVNKIMKREGLTREQKIFLLAKDVFDGAYDHAVDVVDNYDAHEWQVK